MTARRQLAAKKSRLPRKRMLAVHEQDFVVIGWTDSWENAGLGALLLGYYNEAGIMTYAGRCAILSGPQIVEALNKLRPWEISELPLASHPKKSKRETLRPASTHWVKPKVVANIKYADWAADGLLRRASLICWRERSPLQVQRALPSVIQLPKPSPAAG